MTEGLLLFDIDQTLIRSPGCGMAALERAGKEVFGDGFSIKGVDFAGRIDPLILRDLVVANGGEADGETVGRLRVGYSAHLAGALAERATSDRPPAMHAGVPQLLERLASAHPEFGRAVLTGNYEATGMAKLIACGVPVQHFEFFVWGDESTSVPPTRDDLPRVAMERYAAKRGRNIEPGRTVVIGDTPHDVRCARACGCRCLAVATGGTGAAELAKAGADAVVDDLSDTVRTIELLRRMAFG